MRANRNLFRNLAALLLCAVLFPAAGLTALAADAYDFVLYANGAGSAAVEVGDAVEITLAIEGSADYTFYSMQDYVKFDTEFFALDADSIRVKQQQNAVGEYDDMFAYAPILSGDTYDRVFVNRASLTGVAFAAEETILTFTLTARKAGTTEITHYRTEMLDSEGAGITVNEYSAAVTIAAAGGSGGSSSGGSSGGTSSYAVNVRSAENGTVTSSHSTAARGTTVTLTVSPDAGYALDSLTVSNASTGATVTVTKISDTRYTFTMPSAAVSVSASFQPTSSAAAHDDCPSEQFTDVDDMAWYHEYIDYVVESGLMNGTSATTFEPDIATTRGMIVTILHRLEDEPAASVAHGFDDVPSASYYEQSIAWAAENGIVEGYGDGSFGPDDAITREQMAAILYRYAQYKGYDTTQGGMAIREFDDYGDISDYALEAMAWCVNIGIIQGTDSTTITPQNSATRAQIAAILMRFIESISAG